MTFDTFWNLYADPLTWLLAAILFISFGKLLVLIGSGLLQLLRRHSSDVW